MARFGADPPRPTAPEPRLRSARIGPGWRGIVGALGAASIAGLLPFFPVGGDSLRQGVVDAAQAPRTGTIEGVVTLAGTSLPRPTLVSNATDPEVCGEEHSLEDLVVSPESRGVRDVVASLSGVPGDVEADRMPAVLTIDNRDCRFEPHVAVATTGDTVIALNSDRVLHTTHYYGSLRSNVALPHEGMAVARVARVPGLVSVLCDVHGWMKAYVHVDEHPFHAVTDAEGHFQIANVPAGTHTLKLWHERLGEQEHEVRVEPGKVTRLDLTYPFDAAESGYQTMEEDR